MTWNYRVVVERDVPSGMDFYSVREVYYTQRGRPNGWTEPVTLTDFQSVDDVLSELSLLFNDAAPSKLRRVGKCSLLRLRTKRTGKKVLEEVYPCQSQPRPADIGTLLRSRKAPPPKLAANIAVAKKSTRTSSITTTIPGRPKGRPSRISKR